MMKPIEGDYYKHYKGGVYKISTFAKHTETEEELIIYQEIIDVLSIDGNLVLVYGDLWARPLKMFLENVDNEKRFKRIKSLYLMEQKEIEDLLNK